MTATLADTNVLLDIITEEPAWVAWSQLALDEAALEGAVVINEVVYAELSVRFASVADLDAALIAAGVDVVTMPRQALFLAGKAYQRYRKAGGTRTGVLSDFFIGAHAAAKSWPLLTRDVRRYRTYFPAVTLITP